jgi:hypothetical protein
MSTSVRHALRLGALVLSLTGCMAAVDSSPELGEQSAELSLLPDIPLPIRPLEDPLGGPLSRRELKELIDSEREYFTLFGHPAPAEVNWAAGDKVILYSAGLQPTSGFEASLVSAFLRTDYERLPPLLRPHYRRYVDIATRLEAPGVGCVSGPAQSVPYALGVVSTRLVDREFQPTEVKHVDCGGPSCEDIECDPGQHCELEPVICVRAPCPPMPVCVDDPAPAPTCGGLGGLDCPGIGECVDDASDSCEPTRGDTDCSGSCECNVIARCMAPLVWDGSAEVCDCVRPAGVPIPR